MSASPAKAEWIAVDWGTSNLRAWAMTGDTPTAEASSDKGMGRLGPSEFEPALLELVTPWLGARPVTVVACGMVGSRQGWKEAGYVQVPALPRAAVLARPETADPRLRVFILPGLKQSAPPDVMRGEETQIAGFLAGAPDFDGVVCLPGTHTKWAQVSAGEVVSFRTFMTGELFALLSGKSVLRHSVGKGWDDAAFSGAVSDAMAKPEMLAARLFGLRADDLLNGTGGAIARARLSGLLIGAELAAARPYWLGQRVAVLGDAALSRLYCTALAGLGVMAETADATRCTLAGLAEAHRNIGVTVS